MKSTSTFQKLNRYNPTDRYQYHINVVMLIQLYHLYKAESEKKLPRLPFDDKRRQVANVYRPSYSWWQGMWSSPIGGKMKRLISNYV